MKKFILFILLIATLTGCQKKQYFTASPEIDLVKKGSDAYAKGDWAGLRALYADTVKIMVNTWTKDKAVTADQFIEMEKNSTAGYTSYKIGDDAIYEMIITDEGDHWVHTWLNHIMTFKNGKEVNVPVHISSLVTGGKIVWQGFIVDNLTGYLAAQDTVVMK